MSNQGGGGAEQTFDFNSEESIRSIPRLRISLRRQGLPAVDKGQEARNASSRINKSFKLLFVREKSWKKVEKSEICFCNLIVSGFRAFSQTLAA